MPADKAVRLRITGRVQGVGFRDWLSTKAKEGGVNGWARNRRDGSVEVLLGGNADAVDMLIYEAQRGPSGAQVKAIDEDPVTDKVAPGFLIKDTA